MEQECEGSFYPETVCCFCGKEVCCEYSCKECKLKLIDESKE